MTTPRAVLFDADGVLQIMGSGFWDGIPDLVGPGSQADEFVAAVFAAEAGPLVGTGDFRTNLDAVLERWDVQAPVDDVLALWTLVEPIDGLAELCAAVRASGVGCHLATNQTPFRAAYMRSVLGYDALFDRSFYSCEIGARKASPSYFEHVLTTLGHAPGEVLFIDDHRPNVEVARELGIGGVCFDARTHADPAAALRAVLREHGLDVAR